MYSVSCLNFFLLFFLLLYQFHLNCGKAEPKGVIKFFLKPNYFSCDVFFISGNSYKTCCMYLYKERT